MAALQFQPSLHQRSPLAFVHSLSSSVFYLSSTSSLDFSPKFSVRSCAQSPSPMTVVNGNVDLRVPDRSEIRFGLPSKGRMDPPISVVSKFLSEMPKCDICQMPKCGNFVGSSH